MSFFPRSLDECNKIKILYRRKTQNTGEEKFLMGQIFEC